MNIHRTSFSWSVEMNVCVVGKTLALIGVMVVGLGDTSPPKGLPDTRNERQAKPVAMVGLGDHTWTFKGSPTAKGLFVELDTGEGTHGVTLDGNGELGEVLDVVACGQEYSNGATSIALGIASRKERGDGVEYRMAWLFFASPTTEMPEGWLLGRPLSQTTWDGRFQSMSISISHGDSVMFALHRLTRLGGSRDIIETEIFLNNCPGEYDGRLFDELTVQYRAVMVEPARRIGESPRRGHSAIEPSEDSAGK